MLVVFIIVVSLFKLFVFLIRIFCRSFLYSLLFIFNCRILLFSVKFCYFLSNFITDFVLIFIVIVPVITVIFNFYQSKLISLLKELIIYCDLNYLNFTENFTRLR